MERKRKTEIEIEFYLSFTRALSNLCRLADAQIVEQSIGRPVFPIRDTLFAAVLKCYREESARRLKTELQNVLDSGLITQVPSHSTVQRFLQLDTTRQHLLTVIVCALVPLEGGTVTRKHKKVRYASGRRFFGRSYRSLVNEMLCAKICELITKAVWYGVADAYRPKEFSGDADALSERLSEIIPRWLPPDIKDDLFQELVVAVLEGNVTLDTVQNKVNKYLRNVREFTPSQKFISLDDDAHGSNRPLIERLAG